MYKVVIIDDEPIIVEGLSRGIQWDKWNCTVAGSAGSGRQGLEVIKATEPDIVITDISMPNMDGLSMIAALKSQYEGIQIAILTGFRDFNYAQQAIRLGVTRFLLKPSKMDELEEAVLAMTEKLKQRDAMFINRAALQPEADDPAQAAEAEPAGEETQASSFIVKNALAYIREHYAERLKLADVAEQAYVSQWHLSKLLNRHAGQGFSEILNGIRVEKAKELLKEPGMRIGDVAEAVGFLDMAHFSRVFKKIEGISANEYRNTVLSGK